MEWQGACNSAFIFQTGAITEVDIGKVLPPLRGVRAEEGDRFKHSSRRLQKTDGNGIAGFTFVGAADGGRDSR